MYKNKFAIKFVGITATIIYIQRSPSNSSKNVCYKVFFTGYLKHKTVHKTKFENNPR